MTNPINDHIVTYLYVDASNLYGGITDLLPAGSYFDFGSLVSCIKEDFPIHKIKAYGTYMPDEPNATPTKKLEIHAQNKFFQTIRQTPQVEFIKGYQSKTTKKEKGIDVRLAVDMLKDAYEESYKQAIILTGDDDFLYSIECVRKINIPVHLTAFASRFPFGIAHNVNRRVVYDINSHFKARVLPTINRPPANIEIKGITSKVKILSV